MFLCFYIFAYSNPHVAVEYSFALLNSFYAVTFSCLVTQIPKFQIPIFHPQVFACRIHILIASITTSLTEIPLFLGSKHVKTSLFRHLRAGPLRCAAAARAASRRSRPRGARQRRRRSWPSPGRPNGAPDAPGTGGMAVAVAWKILKWITWDMGDPNISNLDLSESMILPHVADV